MTGAPLEEEALAADVLNGQTQAKIAEKYGLSLDEVSRILRGDARPGVARRIAEARRAAWQRAQVRLGLLLDEAVDTLHNTMSGEGKSSTAAFNAAREVLNRAAPSDDEPAPRPAVNLERLAGLSEATKRQVLRELGVPTDEQ